MGARSGDQVRAVTVDTDRTVEGKLVLAYDPVFRAVVVNVWNESRPYWHCVDPDSIEVLSKGRAPRAPSNWTRLEYETPEWITVRDLDLARTAGLVRPISERQGGSWATLTDRIEELVSALVAAGWQQIGSETSPSWEYGDSVWAILLRGGTRIEVELYEDGHIDVYPESTASPDDDDPEPTEPLFGVDSEEALFTEFSARGWTS